MRSRECLRVSTYRYVTIHIRTTYKNAMRMRQVLRGNSDPKQHLRTTSSSCWPTSIKYVVCCMSAVSCQLAKSPFVRCSRLNGMPGQGLKRQWTLPVNPYKESANLKVLQWNVLADGLAQHGDFVKVHIPYSGDAMLNCTAERSVHAALLPIY